VKIDRLMKFLLLVIAVSTSAIALRSYLVPIPVQAQNDAGYPIYVEPGTVMLRAPDGSRQVLGKMMIDLRNGNVWGFPTLTSDPYPSSVTNSSPVTSHPFLLGKFALADMSK
jgi:hypothetical protein